MPSHSPRQQHFFGMVHALQTGAASPADMPAGIRSKLVKTAKGISKKASGEFAHSVEEYISFPALTFKQYLVVEAELMEAFDELAQYELDQLIEVCGLDEAKTGLDWHQEMTKGNASLGKVTYPSDVKPGRGTASKHMTVVGGKTSGKAADIPGFGIKKAKVVKVAQEDEEKSKGKKPAWLTNAEEKAEKKEGKVEEKWDTKYKTPESKKGMWDDWTQAELHAELSKLKKSGPHKEGSSEFTKEKEINFALRSKHGWKGA